MNNFYSQSELSSFLFCINNFISFNYNITMMQFTKYIRVLQSSTFKSRYYIFDSNSQTNFQNEDEEARMQKIFKTFENNESSLTPEKLVQYLDQYVIGQNDAKRAIACAFRNRWRRRDLPSEIRQEITPKNILLKGPTGSGKTEIARRLAKLTESPFLRVQATKYTEVGYVGKDVSTIIQDKYLSKLGVNSYKAKLERALSELRQRVKTEVELQILYAMVGDTLPNDLRDKKLQDIRKGHYNDQVITIMPGYKPNLEIEESFFPQKAITKTVKQIGYYQKLKASYTSIDLQKLALKHVEQDGIVFLDEIDKLAVPEGPLSMAGKGVSTEGVQRDLLPLIQGTTVNTKYGDIKTDHILFIASGSFSMAKIEDLIPQLLGRLPIRVNLSPISKPELVRILKEPAFNLIFQQTRLLETERVKLVFTDDAIQEIAEQAYQMNTHTENLGARRLHSIIEKIIEDISFSAPDYKDKQFVINQAYVKEKLKNQIKSIDLTKFLV